MAVARELLIATRNAGKLRELAPLLYSLGLQAVSLEDAGIVEQNAEDDLEMFETFEENALAKARWFLQVSDGRPVVSDDSGLVVDALDGQPGVRSKRWSENPNLVGDALDRANNEFLLQRLVASGAPEPWKARYLCAAACAWPGGELVMVGSTEGAIIKSARGEGGFGYDRHFLSAELGHTFAEVSREEKAQVSHRARAVRALADALLVIPSWISAYS